MKQKIIISRNLSAELIETVASIHPDRIFVLTDEHTAVACWPYLFSIFSGHEGLGMPCQITIRATDEAKNLDSLSEVWTCLVEGGATRHSLLINLGGGMVTDLGGFAASTFKRGIAYINIPTTLLAMVDASVGGKTGINFRGLKNEIGVFNAANAVFLDTRFLATLDQTNFCSGYAEMIKHALISDEMMLSELFNYDLENPDFESLKKMIAQSVAVKERIVEEDPYEKGVRKALNLGHTVGHAFESLAMSQGCPVLHGYAVAWGLVCELYLSAVLCGFPTNKLHQIAQFVHETYGDFSFTCKEYELLYNLMLHDKKNTAGIINFTLLEEIGNICINKRASKDDIFEMLDYYREM